MRPKLQHFKLASFSSLSNKFFVAQNVAKDATDPDWATSFVVNYHFEAVQEVTINFTILLKPSHPRKPWSLVYSSPPTSTHHWSQFTVRVYHHSSGAPLPTDVNKVDTTKQHSIGEVKFRLSNLMCAASQKIVTTFGNSAKYVCLYLVLIYIMNKFCAVLLLALCNTAFVMSFFLVHSS